MSNRSQAIKKRFHTVCANVIADEWGPSWAAIDTNSDSWTVRFQSTAHAAVRLIDLRLSEQRRVIDIVLGVKQTPDQPPPKIWWEDRSLHPRQTRYAKVLWTGPAYSTEAGIEAPREFWGEALGQAIRTRLCILRPAIGGWFEEAEAAILQRQ